MCYHNKKIKIEQFISEKGINPFEAGLISPMLLLQLKLQQLCIVWEWVIFPM